MHTVKLTPKQFDRVTASCSVVINDSNTIAVFDIPENVDTIGVPVVRLSARIALTKKFDKIKFIRKEN